MFLKYYNEITEQKLKPINVYFYLAGWFATTL